MIFRSPIIFLIVLGSFFFRLYGQGIGNLDSIKQLIKVTGDDSVKVLGLYKIGLYSLDISEGINYMHQAKTVAKKAKRQGLVAQTYRGLYAIHESAGNRDSCLFYLKNMYVAAKKAGRKDLLGKYYLSMPYLNSVYFRSNEHSMAYYDSAVTVFRQLYEKNQAYGRQLADAIGRKIETLIIEMENDPNLNKNTDQRIPIIINLYSQIEPIRIEDGRLFVEASDATALSYLWFFQVIGKYSSSIHFGKRAIEIANGKDPRRISYAYALLAKSYALNQEEENAIKSSEKGIQIAKDNNLVKEYLDNLLNLSEVHYALGNYQMAYNTYKSYNKFADSVNSTATLKAQSLFESQLKNEKLQQEALVQTEKSKQQKFVMRITVIGLILVLIFSVIMIARWRHSQKQKLIIEKQKEIVDQKNSEITESIQYAKRIQDAKLPLMDTILDSFPNCFVMFQPKDIVSGDFYYYYKTNSHIFIAAADCTGHGVPGAIMSMIATERLDDAFAQTSELSEILSKINKGIKVSLKQDENAINSRDGLDIALCRFDISKRELHFSGANRPLWLIRKGTNVITEYKPTKASIGGFTKLEQEFVSHNIELNKGDTIYLFSDGYADTFGGEKDKKLTTRKFKEQLISIQNLEMKEQEKHLTDFIEDWRGSVEQIDDILVIGIRV
ncbi:MAG: SpoIIE family protein phosphatase [Bacteroidia bacterium]